MLTSKEIFKCSAILLMIFGTSCKNKLNTNSRSNSDSGSDLKILGSASSTAINPIDENGTSNNSNIGIGSTNNVVFGTPCPSQRPSLPVEQQVTTLENIVRPYDPNTAIHAGPAIISDTFNPCERTVSTFASADVDPKQYETEQERNLRESFERLGRTAPKAGVANAKRYASDSANFIREIINAKIVYCDSRFNRETENLSKSIYYNLSFEDLEKGNAVSQDRMLETIKDLEASISFFDDKSKIYDGIIEELKVAVEVEKADSCDQHNYQFDYAKILSALDIIPDENLLERLKSQCSKDCSTEKMKALFDGDEEFQRKIVNGKLKMRGKLWGTKERLKDFQNQNPMTKCFNNYLTMKGSGFMVQALKMEFDARSKVLPKELTMNDVAEKFKLYDLPVPHRIDSPDKIIADQANAAIANINGAAANAETAYKGATVALGLVNPSAMVVGAACKVRLTAEKNRFLNAIYRSGVLGEEQSKAISDQIGHDNADGLLSFIPFGATFKALKSIDLAVKAGKSLSMMDKARLAIDAYIDYSIIQGLTDEQRNKIVDQISKDFIDSNITDKAQLLSFLGDFNGQKLAEYLENKGSMSNQQLISSILLDQTFGPDSGCGKLFDVKRKAHEDLERQIRARVASSKGIALDAKKFCENRLK